ncbi:hypothetical protein ACJMK2_010380 [Sinanodonta woodiana]|uniref:CUB domain-containing protein n=1 Tax=Sinanodonta woodiana TaxID=1069815 RepID=A0ABD3VF57_SINWO
MREYCGEELDLMLSNSYSGRVVFNSLYAGKTEDCVMAIKTWYRFPYIAFHFEEMSVGCNSGISITDGEDAEQEQRIEGFPGDPFLCGNIAPKGLYTSKTRYLRLRYKPDPFPAQNGRFSLVFNSYDNGSCETDEYECLNGHCIHEDLNCSGYNPCGDYSDCKFLFTSIGVIGLVIGVVAAAGLLIGICTCICCWKRKPRRRRSTSPSASAHFVRAPFEILQSDVEAYNRDQIEIPPEMTQIYPSAPPIQESGINFNCNLNYQTIPAPPSYDSVMSQPSLYRPIIAQDSPHVNHCNVRS